MRPRHSAVTSDLKVLADALNEMGARRLVKSDVHDVVRLLDTYGFHSADSTFGKTAAFTRQRFISSWSLPEFLTQGIMSNGQILKSLNS